MTPVTQGRSSIAPAMARRIEIWPVGRLIPYVKNPRTHSEEQVAQIAASIVEFGFTAPILVASDAGILAGHGRLLAVRKLGLSEVLPTRARIPSRSARGRRKCGSRTFTRQARPRARFASSSPPRFSRALPTSTR